MTEPNIKPLPYKRRKHAFLLLLGLFLFVIPFLYLYATGYRYDFSGEGALISTGGLFIAAERTGAEIYVDGELVRETRVFRKAFYAQRLDPGTHRVHVQKTGNHTWVKELPVYPHLVTEAQAFNLPVVPQARVVTKWISKDNLPVVMASSTLVASTTQQFFLATTTATTTYTENPEYAFRVSLFKTPSTTVESVRGSTIGVLPHTASTSVEKPTTTKSLRGVELHEYDHDVYARWVGPREEMPYYYCAETFELMGTSTVGAILPDSERAAAAVITEDDVSDELLDPVVEVPDDQVCEQEIRIDRKNQHVRSFDFFPGSIDLVVMALEDGVYVVEVDNRAWQNMQPLITGEGLDMRVENNRIYVYDGYLIYEMILE